MRLRWPAVVGQWSQFWVLGERAVSALVGERGDSIGAEERAGLVLNRAWRRNIRGRSSGVAVLGYDAAFQRDDRRRRISENAAARTASRVESEGAVLDNECSGHIVELDAATVTRSGIT